MKIGLEYVLLKSALAIPPAKTEADHEMVINTDSEPISN